MAIHDLYVVIGISGVVDDLRAIVVVSDRPARKTLPRGIGTAILKDTKRPSTDRGVDGTQLPTVPQSGPEATDRGYRVNTADVEVQLDVMVATAPVLPEVGNRVGSAPHRIAVVDLRIVALTSAIRGVQVHTLAPSQVVLGVESAPPPLVKRRLQAVVLRGAQISRLNYVLETWKGLRIRP